MIFQAEGLTFKYRQVEVLKNISLSIEAGDFVALLGPNGGGKSTLLKVLAGILPAGSGRLLAQGEDFSRFTAARRAQKVAYVSAFLTLEFPVTAYQAVLMGRTTTGSSFALRVRDEDHQKVREAMERCDCWRLRDRDVRELSGGERQLVHLARALSGAAKILLLDEAISQMDLHHQARIGQLLKNLTSAQGYAVILVAHDVNLASEWARDCILLQHGEIIAHGPVRETLTLEGLQALYPGAALVVGKNPSTGAPKVFFAESILS